MQILRKCVTIKICINVETWYGKFITPFKWKIGLYTHIFMHHTQFYTYIYVHTHTYIYINSKGRAGEKNEQKL